MTCYHPLKGFQIGYHSSGKPNYFITSYEAHHVEKHSGHWTAVFDDTRSKYSTLHISEFVTIPCGQCVGCRLDYSRQWADRCMLEAQYHDSSYFVTLTYDDISVPKHIYVDDDGCINEVMSLCKRDFQLFMKRLRKAFPNDNIRYFVAGEYGSETFRPHYHAIIYGLHLDDLTVYKRSLNGFIYYNSEKLDKVWSVDGKKLGHVVVAEVTWDTCAYTARYCMKKINSGLSGFYEYHNIDPEFTLMSRRPGIARQYYDDHKDSIYEFEHINILTEKGGKKIRPPRYFDRLYDVEYPIEMKEIKEKRKELAETLLELKLKETDLSYMELLQVEKNNKLAQVKKLLRKEI